MLRHTDGRLSADELVLVRPPSVASNKGFEEWGEIFGDEVLATALIDRLLHHCHIVNIRGNSYRMRHHAELWGQSPPPGGVLERRARSLWPDC